jgi:hypothetical protein
LSAFSSHERSNSNQPGQSKAGRNRFDLGFQQFCLNFGKHQSP